MAQRRFLNVRYSDVPSRIDVDGIERWSQVKDAIKAKFGEDIPASSVRIQLFNQQNNMVADLDDVPDEYFKEDDKGGLYLTIRLISLPSELSGIVVETAESIVDRYLAKTSISFENMWSDSRCLTLDLGDRITSYNFDDKNNVKLLIGLSGGGKTRTMLELLFKQYGHYFVANTFDGVGSRDLERCIRISQSQPSQVGININALMFVRTYLLNWFKKCGFSSEQWLFAQLYPRQVFGGSDPFVELFYHLTSTKTYIPMSFGNCPVIVDEAQDLLLERTTSKWREFSTERPFLSPLLLHMKPMARTFVISGTGMDYSVLNVIDSSRPLKDIIFAYVHIKDLPFLDALKVKNFASSFIEKRLVLMGLEYTRIYKQVAVEISNNVLCHGRPRVAAFVIDIFFQFLADSKAKSPQQSIADAFLCLENNIRGIFDDQIVRLIQDEPDKETVKIIGGKTFTQVVTEMFVDSLVTGKGEIKFLKGKNFSLAAEMVSRGVGFMAVENDAFLNKCSITLLEPAVKLYLSIYLDFNQCLEGIYSKILDAPRNIHVGDWFEFLVAAALVKKFGSANTKIYQSSLLLEDYLLCEFDNTFIKTDDMCGPDIVFKNGNAVWIVQVRCVKTFYRKYRLNSAATTDPNLLFTVRDTTSPYFGMPLKGYEERHKSVIDAFKVLKNRGFKIYQVVVASSRVKIPSDDLPGITWIHRNSEIGKTFFEPLNGDAMFVWDLLDAQCNDDIKFEEPNVKDPYNWDDEQ